MVEQTAGLGMGSSGVRKSHPLRVMRATLSRVRRVLFAAHLIQGMHGDARRLALAGAHRDLAFW